MDVVVKGCNGIALHIPSPTSETIVIATRCVFANNIFGATVEGSLTSATFNNCVFNDNKEMGIFTSGATIHLHGEATAIHSNGLRGIEAKFSAKVIIHLPSHHNTSYNNTNGDRYTTSGGTITNV